VGGIAHVLEEDFGLRIPRRLQIDLAHVIQEQADESGEEILPAAILASFEKEYFREGPIALLEHASEGAELRAVVLDHGEKRRIAGVGKGPLAAFVEALREGCGLPLDIVDYAEHALGEGAEANAMAYVELATPSGSSIFGVGRSASLLTASLEAVVSAVNRALRRGDIVRAA